MFRDNLTAPSQDLLISSSTDRRSSSPKRLSGSEKSVGGTSKIPYKKACERPPTSVARRNARERKRVHTVNQMFSILKTRLPTLRSKTKRVSKLKILKAAMEYIYDLQDVLDGCPPMPSTDHLRSFDFPTNNHQIDNVTSTYNIARSTTGVTSTSTGQGQPLLSAVDSYDCIQYKGAAHAPPLKGSNASKWTALRLPAVSDGGPPGLFSDVGHGYNNFCEAPPQSENSTYDSNYYYYGHQAYQY